MTSFVQNAGGTLFSQFSAYPGGPSVDLDATPTITITNLDTSVVAVGPTSVGVGHPATGMYSYPWSAPVDAGQYLAVWDGLYLTNPVQASELFTVVFSAPSGAGPCSAWSPIWCEELPLSTAAISGAAIQIATEVLWMKSGRQFDECTYTIRPCRKTCYNGVWPFERSWGEFGSRWPYPYQYNGLWYNLGCGGCAGDCSCTVLHSVELPSPVSSITEVKVDGVALDASAYMLYDNRTLVRVDGSAWPRCNDLSKADTEVGTWSITFTVGTPVPSIGRLAVGELAREIALGCVSDGSCKLNPAVQQVVRQGVTMSFIDPNIAFADGKLGLYYSDLFISSVNPGGIPARAKVVNMDGPRARRQTWP